MRLVYEPILISSPAHLARFTAIARQNPWWRTLLGLTTIPADFPRVYVGGRAVPVNFFAKGSLHLGERQLAFEPRDPGFDNGQRYAHLTPDFRLALPYAHLTQLARYEAAEPPVKYFNLNWVQLHVSGPQAPGDLLLSATGSGTQMARIAQTNEQLCEELRAKLPAR